MPYFYGVYLQNTKLSTGLDLIRFLSEPDSIRFSHVTLRGPYEAKLSRIWLLKINERGKYDWRISLAKPSKFFVGSQSTVVIRAHLGNLQGLVHKPAFPEGVPHLTVYDGSDRRFADAVFRMLELYDWNQAAEVTPLRLILKKQKVDETFERFWTAFYDLFQKIVGDPAKIRYMKEVSADRRLNYIHEVLVYLRASEQITAGVKPFLQQNDPYLNRGLGHFSVMGNGDA